MINKDDIFFEKRGKITASVYKNDTGGIEFNIGSRDGDDVTFGCQEIDELIMILIHAREAIFGKRGY